MELFSVMKQIASGFGSTLIIFFFTLLFSMPLGILVALGRMSKFKPLSLLIQAIISILRGTPLMLQLIVVFYGPYYLFGIKLSSNWRLIATLIGFSINYAAYFAEIFRAGIQSIPVGQTEAATVLGYTKTQTFLKIIFPQMVKRTIPPVTNEVITLVKDTSLASAIGTVEMFTKAKQIAVSPRSPGMLTFLVAGVFYFVFNAIVAFVMKRIEKALSYYD